MLIKRLDVTVQALLWSDRVQVRHHRCNWFWCVGAHIALPSLCCCLQEQVDEIVKQLEAQRAGLRAEPALIEAHDALEASAAVVR